MNQKTLAQIMITLIAIAIGSWQYFGVQRQTEPAAPVSPAPSMPAPRADSRERNTKSPRQEDGRQERGERSNRSVDRAGDFDYYVVSLSWSPSNCMLNPDDQRECGKGYGFVLHGLWPQKTDGGYLEDCPMSEQLPESVVRKTLVFMPVEALIHREWTKYGSCSGLSAEAYFSLADQAFASVRLPPRFEQPLSVFALTADEVLRDFAASNPSFPAGSFTVQCTRNKLQEVRM